MAFESAKQGGRLSASELRRVGAAIDRSRLHGATGVGGGVSSSRGGSAIIPTGDEFFTAKITGKTAGTPNLYSFVEVWGPNPDTGEYEEKPSGRTADKDTNPAIAVEGTVYAVDDIVLARRHTTDPNKYEIVTVGNGSGTGEFIGFARLTARSSELLPYAPYSWQERVYGAGGAEQAGTQSGDLNAYPVAPWHAQPLTVGPGVTGSLVVMWRGGDGHYFAPAEPASIGVSGFVTIDAQSFSGEKSFADKLFAQGALSVLGNADASGDIIAAGAVVAKDGFFLVASKPGPNLITNQNDGGHVSFQSDIFQFAHHTYATTAGFLMQMNAVVPWSDDYGVVWSDYYGRPYVKAIKQGSVDNAFGLEHVFYGDARVIGWNSSTIHTGSNLIVGTGDVYNTTGSYSGYVKVSGDNGIIKAYSSHDGGAQYHIIIDPTGSDGFISVVKVED